MRILCFSDIHLHNWHYGSSIVGGMNSRLMDQASVLNQIAQYTYENSVDRVVFGGDLFHTHGKLDSSVLKVAFQGLSRITNPIPRFNPIQPMPAVFLVGNHDTDRKDKSVHSLHWLASTTSCVVDSSFHDKLSGLSYLSYTESKDEVVDFFKHAGPICFLHQGIANVPMGSGFLINEILSADLVPDHVKYVYTGHYHKHTRVSDKITIIGSTLQLNWSDEGDSRGFLVIDTDTGTFEHVETKAPRFVTINMNNHLRPNRNNEEPIMGNFVRVTNAEKAFQEDIRQEFTEAGARSVEFVPKEEVKVKMNPISHDIFHLPTIVSEYEKAHNITEERSQVGKELMT